MIPINCDLCGKSLINPPAAYKVTTGGKTAWHLRCGVVLVKEADGTWPPETVEKVARTIAYRLHFIPDLQTSALAIAVLDALASQVGESER